MNRTPLPLLLLLIFGWLAPLTLRADPDSPYFGLGTTLEFNGITFDWSSATEDGTWHYDYYVSSSTSEQLTVSGVLAFTGLASISGTAGTASVDGYFVSGAYTPGYKFSSVPGTYNVSGYQFSIREETTTQSPNWTTGQLESSGLVRYIGESGDYYDFNSYADGTTAQSYSVHTSGPSSAYPNSSINLFGGDYVFASGTRGGSSSSTGAATEAWTDHFTSQDGGSLDLSYYTDAATSVHTETMSGWDAVVGSFNAENTTPNSFANFDGFSFAPRTAPSFAPIWFLANDDAALVWQSGEIAADGTVTDHYADLSNDISVVIAQGVRIFANSGTADVTVTQQTNNLSGSGTYSSSSGFSVNGWNLVVLDPAQSPNMFFTTHLFVDGTDYAYAGGYGDYVTSARTEVWFNASAGMLIFSGQQPLDPENFLLEGTLTYFGTIEHGSYTFYSLLEGEPPAYHFSGFTHAISGPPEDTDPPPVVGPPGYWLRGNYYWRTQTENLYTSAIYRDIFLNWDANEENILMSGYDLGASFSGISQPGSYVFIINDGDGNPTIPVFTTNDSGIVQISGNVPANYPPAVVSDGLIWTYIGTAADNADATKTAHYYAGVAAYSNPWLLKIRPDTGAATIYYYDSTGAVSTALGTYNPVTKVFQTADSNTGFPPIWGVDPTNNYRIWFPNPPAGVPSVFLVSGQVWRYTGTDQNGNSTYYGNYTGQLLVLGPAAEGGRIVTVTDPIGGNSSGTLNNVREAVALGNGRTIYTGDYEGQRLLPDLNPDALHTIAADLDITGNLVSFGTLSDDPSSAGVTLQFHDADGIGTLHTAIARPLAEWTWWKIGTTVGSLQQVMKLDQNHTLTLTDPATGQPGVTLDPRAGGVSIINGVLRIPPAGDISMGEFQNVPQP